MKRDDIELALVATLWAFPDLNVAANEEAAELVPFRNKLFEVISGHQRPLFV
jgi:hypothetical protein